MHKQDYALGQKSVTVVLFFTTAVQKQTPVWKPAALGVNSCLCSCSFTVKPSKPFCKIEGTPEKGHLIYLLCKCEEGLPHPTYHWYKVDDSTLTPVTEQFST